MSSDPIALDGATDPVFGEPWEAHAFALVVVLQERGLFSWSEWAEALGIHTAETGKAADYAAWLSTVEGLLAARDVVAPEVLAARRAAFTRAADATPHGEPVLLANDPLASGFLPKES